MFSRIFHFPNIFWVTIRLKKRLLTNNHLLPSYDSFVCAKYFGKPGNPKMDLLSRRAKYVVVTWYQMTFYIKMENIHKMPHSHIYIDKIENMTNMSEIYILFEPLIIIFGGYRKSEFMYMNWTYTKIFDSAETVEYSKHHHCSIAAPIFAISTTSKKQLSVCFKNSGCSFSCIAKKHLWKILCCVTQSWQGRYLSIFSKFLHTILKYSIAFFLDSTLSISVPDGAVGTGDVDRSFISG